MTGYKLTGPVLGNFKNSISYAIAATKEMVHGNNGELACESLYQISRDIYSLLFNKRPDISIDICIAGINVELSETELAFMVGLEKSVRDREDYLEFIRMNDLNIINVILDKLLIRMRNEGIMRPGEQRV